MSGEGEGGSEGETREVMRGEGGGERGKQIGKEKEGVSEQEDGGKRPEIERGK